MPTTASRLATSCAKVVITWLRLTCAQASEKGWGAAAWMAKAVAEAQGGNYTRHDEFADTLNRIRRATDDNRLRTLRRVANELQGYFYTRKRFLDAEDISEGLDRIAELLDVLEPFTETHPQ